MKSNLLIPNKYKKVGWIILLPSIILGIFVTIGDYGNFSMVSDVFVLAYENLFNDRKTFGVINTDITNTVLGVMCIIGALLVSFSKEKREDEFIANLRLTSLLWAVLVNYGLLLFCFIFIYGISFLHVMVYNMFTVLIIFIIRFNYLLNRSSKMSVDEQ